MEKDEITLAVKELAQATIENRRAAMDRAFGRIEALCVEGAFEHFEFRPGDDTSQTREAAAARAGREHAEEIWIDVTETVIAGITARRNQQGDNLEAELQSMLIRICGCNAETARIHSEALAEAIEEQYGNRRGSASIEVERGTSLAPPQGISEALAAISGKEGLDV